MPKKTALNTQDLNPRPWDHWPTGSWTLCEFAIDPQRTKRWKWNLEGGVEGYSLKYRMGRDCTIVQTLNL